MTDPSNALFARSTATETLIALLAACPEGQTVTFADMSRATNRDIQRKDRHLLATAINTLRRERRALFATVIRLGVQRLFPHEVNAEGQRRLKRISGAARRGGKVMDAAEIERLNPDQRLAHAATRGVFASIETSSKISSPSSSGVANRDPQVVLVKP